MNIVESITGTGVKTSKLSASERMQLPQSGDIVDFCDNPQYPFKGKIGRISAIGQAEAYYESGDDTAHVCCELGSAYLREDGSVDISGGPFTSIKLEDLEPCGILKEASFWNWGDRRVGAHQGVYYRICRPVFKLKKQEDKTD